MNKNTLRIVFMGTPAFATTILAKLITEQFNVVGCVTVPDKPAGRGRKLQESDVKKFATEQEIPTLQPEKLKDESFVQALAEWKADLFIVVAFRMLPKVVWSMPPLGTINLHGSLLPNYRGAAPINWAVINGEKETGVTSFFINETIDTGDILLQEKMPIGDNETAGEVHDRMMQLGADVIVNTINQLMNNAVMAIPQENFDLSKIKEAPKLFKEDGKLNFEEDITALHNRIRGLSPFPSAWLKLKHIDKGEFKTFKIYKSEIHSTSPNKHVSITVENQSLILQSKNGSLILHEVQIEGKRKMQSSEFIRGFRADEWLVDI